MKLKRVTTIPDFPLPVRASAGAAAYDLHAAITEQVRLMPGQQMMISTGYAWEIPRGKVGLLLPRSSKGAEGAVLANICGVIDADYRGEVKAMIWNRLPGYDLRAERHNGQHIGVLLPVPAPTNPFGGLYTGGVTNVVTINPGERFCQLLIVDAYTDTLELVNELAETERGAGGFGSTGTN